MKYVVLVSHGTFSIGLQSVLEMLAGGKREDVKSIGLEDGMDGDTFSAKFKEIIAPFTQEDEVILLGDIVGGSPLTNAVNELSSAGFLGKTVVFGGMNLAMALTAVLMKDSMDTTELKIQLLEEGKNAMKEFVIEDHDDEDI